VSKRRDRERLFSAPAGHSQPPMNYGHALLTQKGGWTRGEFSESTGKKGSEGALDKASRPERRPEKTS
jgi:hypothetical protein